MAFLLSFLMSKTLLYFGHEINVEATLTSLIVSSIAALSVPPLSVSAVPPSTDLTVPSSSTPTVPSSSTSTVASSSAPTVPSSSTPTVPSSSTPTDSLYEARQKAILAEDTSNLEVENSIKQRRINIIQADESDKSEVESDCSEEFIEKKKKVIDVHKKMKHVEKSYSLPKPKSPIQIIPKPVPPSFLSVKRSDSFNQSDWNDCDIEITRHNTTVLENKTYMPTFDSSANFASTSQTNTILTAILTQIEDIKQTLKVHSAILQSLVQQDRGINASLCQLPEDIKLPILTYEDLLVMDQKLIDPLVKKYGSVKVNATTLDANKKQIEAELSKWFTNSRDRGSDRRGRKKRLKDINNESDFIFNK
nr:uncharacterized protein LOC124810403 isoform X4 [Hydra vulgaris]